MATLFPKNPTDGQYFTNPGNDRLYKYESTVGVWDLVKTPDTEFTNTLPVDMGDTPSATGAEPRKINYFFNIKDLKDISSPQ